MWIHEMLSVAVMAALGIARTARFPDTAGKRVLSFFQNQHTCTQFPKMEIVDKTSQNRLHNTKDAAKIPKTGKPTLNQISQHLHYIPGGVHDFPKQKSVENAILAQDFLSWQSGCYLDGSHYVTFPASVHFSRKPIWYTAEPSDGLCMSIVNSAALEFWIGLD